LCFECLLEDPSLTVAMGAKRKAPQTTAKAKVTKKDEPVEQPDEEEPAVEEDVPMKEDSEEEPVAADDEPAEEEDIKAEEPEEDENIKTEDAAPAATEKNAAPRDPHFGKLDGRWDRNKGQSLMAQISRAIAKGEEHFDQQVQDMVQKFVSRVNLRKYHAVAEFVNFAFSLAGCGCSIVTADDIENHRIGHVLAEWVQDCLNSQVDITSYILIEETQKAQAFKKHLLPVWTAIFKELEVTFLAESVMDVWLAALKDLLPCKLRPLRHAATMLGLMTVDAASASIARVLVEQSILERQTKGKQGKRLTELNEDIDRLSKEAMIMADRCEKLAHFVVNVRFQDSVVQIRVQILAAIRRWFSLDRMSFVTERWIAHLVWGLLDPDAMSRCEALRAVRTLFAEAKELETCVHKQIKDLGDVVHKRCYDDDADVRNCAVEAIDALVQKVPDAFDDLTFEKITNILWDGRKGAPHTAAAVLVNTHIFSEPGICEDSEHKESLEQSSASSQALAMILEYIQDFQPKKLRLIERVVDGFWGKAKCLQDFGQMCSNALLGEAQQSEFAPLGSERRKVMLYLLEASVRRAFDESANVAKDKASSVMLQAVVEICPKAPQLVSMIASDDESLVLMAHVLRMICNFARGNGVAASRMSIPAVATCLRNIITQSSCDLAVQYAAVALTDLTYRSTEPAQTLQGAAKDLRQICQPALKKYKPGDEMAGVSAVARENAEAMVSSANRLSALSQHFAVLPEYGMVNQMIQVLKARAKSGKSVGVRVTLTFLELVHSTLFWHAHGWAELGALLDGRDVVADVQKADMDAVAALQVRLTGTDMETVRDGLWSHFAAFRDVCIELVARDANENVQFAAFSIYFLLLRCWHSVEHAVRGQELSKDLWEFDRLHTDSQALEAYFRGVLQAGKDKMNLVQPDSTCPGVRIKADVMDCFVVPPDQQVDLLRSMVAGMESRFRTSSMSDAEFQGVQEEGYMYIAVRMVAECISRDIYMGPMAQLVLMQFAGPKCELTKYAAALLRRLKEMADEDPDNADYFDIQLATMKLAALDKGSEFGCQVAVALGKRTFFSIKGGLVERFENMLIKGVQYAAGDEDRYVFLDCLEQYVKVKIYREFLATQIEKTVDGTTLATLRVQAVLSKLRGAFVAAPELPDDD